MYTRKSIARIITSREIRVGKMDELLKLLPYRHEYLSSVPENLALPEGGGARL